MSDNKDKGGGKSDSDPKPDQRKEYDKDKTEFERKWGVKKGDPPPADRNPRGPKRVN